MLSLLQVLQCIGDLFQGANDIKNWLLVFVSISLVMDDIAIVFGMDVAFGKRSVYIPCL